MWLNFLMSFHPLLEADDAGGGGTGKSQQEHMSDLSKARTGGGDNPPTPPKKEAEPTPPANPEPPKKEEDNPPAPPAAPATPPKAEDDPNPPLDIISALAELLDAGNQAPPQEPPAPKPGENGGQPTPPPTPPTPPTPPAMSQEQMRAGSHLPFQFKLDLKDGETFDNILESQEKFEGIVGRSLSASVNQILDKAVGSSVSEMQKGLSNTVTEEVAIQLAAQNFWNQNKDLKPVHQLVVNQANKIIRQKPNMSLPDVYEQAGKAVRTIIEGLQKATGGGANPPGSNGNGNFAGTGGGGAPRGGQGGKELTGKAKQIADLINYKQNR